MKPMRKLNLVNENYYYVDNPRVLQNKFIGREKDKSLLPSYEESAKLLPRPVWDGHEDAQKMSDFTWKTAFGNLGTPSPDTHFVSNFIDTAFNGFLFMWDSSFIVQFGKYGSKVFNFQRTLDNFYSNQHKDGFICRELCETRPGEQFARDDLVSTGPNILAFAEWEYYKQTGDIERIKDVFEPLCAYHEWLRLNRTWRDGSYFSTGLGCGMDNQPRVPDPYNHKCSNGHAVWSDACFQQLLSCKILVEMSKLIGKEDETDGFKKEIERLSKTVNKKLWSEDDSFYYDLWYDEDNDCDCFSGVKTIGAYWALLADIVPKDRMEGFVAHLENEKEFKRPHRCPSLSADHPMYDKDGGYWLGSVWAPANYMLLKGLRKNGYDKLAYEIALNHYENVLKVFNETGTVWECYAPESASRGNRSKSDFVGWTGLVPISVLYEFVFGLEPDSYNNKVTWYVNRCERHGVMNYPLKDGICNLICEARKENEEPHITIEADFPVTVEVVWNSTRKTVTNV